MCLGAGEAKGVVRIHPGALQLVNQAHPPIELPPTRALVGQAFILEGSSASVLSNRALAQF
jgi:hypothetical protein